MTLTEFWKYSLILLTFCTLQEMLLAGKQYGIHAQKSVKYT